MCVFVWAGVSAYTCIREECDKYGMLHYVNLKFRCIYIYMHIIIHEYNYVRVYIYMYMYVCMHTGKKVKLLTLSLLTDKEELLDDIEVCKIISSMCI